MPRDSNMRQVQGRIIFYSIIGIVVTAITVAILTLAPFYTSMKEAQDAHVRFAREMTGQLVDQYLSRKKDIARQVASRTKAWQLLREHEQGKITQSQMQQYLSKILMAAMRQSDLITGITRLDRKSKPLVQVGETIPRTYWPNMVSERQPRLIGPFKHKGQTYITVSTNVFTDDGERIGRDVLMFNISDMHDLLLTEQRHGNSGKFVLAHRENGTLNAFMPLKQEALYQPNAVGNELLNQAFMQSIVKRQEGTLHGNFKGLESVIAFAPIQNAKWGIAIVIPKKTLYATVRWQMLWVGLAVCLLALILALTFLLLLRPLTGKLIIHEDELQHRIDEQTAELKKANVLLDHLATHDVVTQLINRRHFETLVMNEVHRSMRYKREFALLYIDIDNFKDVNDNWGHQAGDQFLKEISQRLQHAIRTEDIVGRIGGDEFAILMPEVSGRQNVEALIERVHTSFGRDCVIEGHHLRITVSIGIAIFPEHGITPEALLAAADTAMYQAKLSKTTYYHFAPDNGAEPEATA